VIVDGEGKQSSAKSAKEPKAAADPLSKAATVGQFMPLQKRTEKIRRIIDDIIAH
jgi:hypothetical protein